MRTQVKLGLYVLTLLGTLVFGNLFLRAWKDSGAGATGGKSAAAERKAPTPAKLTTTTAEPGSTNSAGLTNATSGPVAVTNAAAAASTTSATNAPTEAAAPSTADVSASEPTPEQEVVPSKVSLGTRSRGLGRIVTWGLLAVAALIAFGTLVAYDVSRASAGKAMKVMYNEDYQAPDATDYEKIEAEYAGGNHLETIRLLRDFLKKNPKAAHAQIRIAEIYEKDLNNALAAALEYEEVLKFRLDPDRRGWTCIHLVNLYNRMGRQEQAIEMLQRIVRECPDTPAAGKARDRLAAAGIETPGADGDADADSPGSGDDEPPTGLPRGFKRK